ncbi:MAG: 1-deoxy-D-xylulose-5-phosphate reductoisomerase, partial [Vallitaleaceae bacterium]|nr:1-deoxy-D-xylulose-5-phosphate reductoisomerase [Vallitaleaceae bacterium]
MNPIKIAILGSSGSIGTQTLEVVRLHKEFKVLGISGNRNIEEIFTQCKEFHPQLAVMMNNEAAEELKALLHKEELHEIQVLSGMDGLMALAVMEEVQILVTAIVGMIGLRPTIAAIKCKKTIALANKETLVTAGELIMPLAKKMGVKIIPVDSEHSAIYQSIANVPYDRIEKVILTASGGPFRGKKAEDLKKVSREEALRHPNWAMGAKITIDSST